MQPCEMQILFFVVNLKHILRCKTFHRNKSSIENILSWRFIFTTETKTYHKWPIPWWLILRTTNLHIKRLIENWIQWLLNSLGLHLHFHLCVDFVRFRNELDLSIGIWVAIRVHRDEILCLPHCKITTTRKQVLKRISYLTNLGSWYPNLLPKGTPAVCTKETWFCRLQSGTNA